jgi:hypothetical protein
MNAHAQKRPWKVVKAFEVTQACGHAVLLPSSTPVSELAIVAGVECVECAVSLMEEVGREL